jgi:hypothetical protein
MYSYKYINVNIYIGLYINECDDFFLEYQTSYNTAENIEIDPPVLAKHVNLKRIKPQKSISVHYSSGVQNRNISIVSVKPHVLDFKNSKSKHTSFKTSMFGDSTPSHLSRTEIDVLAV